MEKNNFTSPELETDTLETLSAKLIQTTAELSRANLQLLRYQKERNEMLANISHDLRAPITAIRSTLDLLKSQKEPSEKDMRDALNLIDRRTATLESLIQDMYFLFTLENPSAALDFKVVDAAPLLEEYFFDCSENPLYANHKLELELSPSLSAPVRIDVQKMLRVLDNLFTNAAKYSGDGTTITLRADLLKDSSQLFIEVKDNGIGIPADAISHIFDRTYTVSRARTPGKTAGSGLGLCIVQTILEKFGGTVSCESRENAGCSFQILLPLAAG